MMGGGKHIFSLSHPCWRHGRNTRQAFTLIRSQNCGLDFLYVQGGFLSQRNVGMIVARAFSVHGFWREDVYCARITKMHMLIAFKPPLLHFDGFVVEGRPAGIVLPGSSPSWATAIIVA
eukprot:CAMPEP_0115872406 /NCGR_PEP_ID=MMETSP0287-20121206/23403_1 /TAXON_ID=412157 /ORGANISM="Chrysochromulina rotalis, Strain UIO044" /LENGTH=118 /DNA_ID=CAMNT_0003327313 /DNA_START=135 /DNA_END=487 /DNA_ORIENTATION=+